MIELSRERPRYAKEIIPRTMRKTELLLQANQFRKRLSSVKEGICLLAGDWYPYDSMSSIASLDGFLKGELAALRQLTGNDPVLDIGCGDGDVAFFLESLGCPVRVIDHPPTNNNHMYGVEALKCALRSKVEIQAADLDRRIDLPDPHYGLTLLLGILYHLKNPYAILEALAKKSRYCFLSTRIASLSPDKKTHFGDLPVAYLLDEAETNQDETNYWIFSEAGLRRILRRTGWDVKQYRAVGNATASNPVSAAGDARAYCLLESRVADRANSIRLLHGWHQLESGAWRWSERRFSVRLPAPPPGKPATLRFQFHVPPSLAAARPLFQVTATVDGECLRPQTYASPGDHQYVCAVPAAASPAATRLIDFELDTAVGPTDSDSRELGVLVDFGRSSPIVFC